MPRAAYEEAGAGIRLAHGRIMGCAAEFYAGIAGGASGCAGCGFRVRVPVPDAAARGCITVPFRRRFEDAGWALADGDWRSGR